ncbi:hypothetical protein KP509_18G040100 [Ceratopteris richardii]|uniref:Uncharacterized protein n=1 Tax=Ceratopteris richardii TaxID=49495 RepID=A0A8T2SSP1_CERRI|nr:hypothetical protein KP509_18G040100 [Ceratopteris richardii]
MNSCSGLPICLSGIRIIPQNQRPVQADGRIWPTSVVPERFTDGGTGASDEASPSNVNRDQGDAREERTSEVFINRTSWPRLALAQQMADLDLRRDSMRRRRLYRRSHLLDYRMSSQKTSMIAAWLQEQSRPEADTPNMPKSICAKAA